MNLRLILACAALTLSLGKLAHAQHADIQLSVRSGRLSTGGQYLAEEVLSDHASLNGIEYYGIDDPGVNRANPTPPGNSILPANKQLLLTLESFQPRGMPSASNLWHWDVMDSDANGIDVNDVSFQPVSGSASFNVSKFDSFGTLLQHITATGADADVGGYLVATTDFTGGVHVHPNFDVRAPLPAGVESGVYMVAMSFQMAGYQSSDPVYLMFRTPDTDNAAQVAAETWFDRSSGLVVPEPGTLSLLASAGAGLLVLRRRRK